MYKKHGKQKSKSIGTHDVGLKKEEDMEIN